tara:strand:- start:838 stop:2235 length:1398 start_codon:yes stop_codon:yes gene_type:complete
LDKLLFEKNLALLKKNTLGLIDLHGELPKKVTLLHSKSGLPTAEYKNILLHSKYDPEKEGQDFSKNIKPGSRLCLYGFGLGYHLPPLLEKIGPMGFLLVIELNKDILSTALKLKDHSQLFQSNCFKLIYGNEEARVYNEISLEMKKLMESGSDNLEVLFHPPSFKCFPQNFPALKNALEILLMERKFPAIFGDLEQINYSLNKTKIKESHGINSLKNIHLSQPGIIVSAGPSLDTALPYLKHIQNDFLITCVDTAFPVLLQAEIKPEYVFSLDPQSESAIYFADYKNGSTKLVFTATANHDVLKNFPGECFVVYKEGHISSQPQEIKQKGATQAGGSVSCLALDALIQFGCNPVFLVGQDCALTSNRYYSKSTRFNQLLVSKISGIRQLNQLHQTKFNEKTPVKIKNTYGSELLTDQVMYSYLRNLEQIAKQNKNTEIYNLCSTGAAIEGANPLNSISELRRWLV